MVFTRSTDSSRVVPSRRRPRRARAALLCSLAFAPALALAVSGTGSAHSGAPVTTPKPGATVAALPATVSITFGDRLARVNRVTVVDSKGANHARSARLDARNAARVLVRTSAPVPGAYTVRWQVTSEDGHVQSGSFPFRVRP